MVETSDSERMGDVVDVLQQVRDIDNLIVSGYEVQAQNPTQTSVNITIGVFHD